MIEYGVVNYVFGAPGVGKTTFLAYLSRKYLKMGYRVYTNFSLKDCIEIKDEELGYYSFENSVLLLDELGISMSNRDFKKGLMTDPMRLSYFKRIRHYLQKNKKGCCWVATQGWNDIDKKVRDLSTSYYLLSKWFGFTVLKPIFKDCDIDPLTHEPADYFEKSMFIYWRLIWRRLYYKFFDSYDAPQLPEYPVTSPKWTETEKNGRKRLLLADIFRRLRTFCSGAAEDESNALPTNNDTN